MSILLIHQIPNITPGCTACTSTDHVRSMTHTDKLPASSRQGQMINTGGVASTLETQGQFPVRIDRHEPPGKDVGQWVENLMAQCDGRNG